MKAAVAAFLLVFATVVVAGVVFYQFAFDLTEKMKTTFPVQALQLESFDINETCLTVRVRNFASASVQVTEIYVNDQICRIQKPVTIMPNSIGAVNLHGKYVKGGIYVVKVFSGLGLPLVFNVEYQ